MERHIRPKSTYQIVFALMAALLLCSLVAGVFGPIALDAFSDDDGQPESGNLGIDESIEQSMRATAEASPASAASAATLANYLVNTGKLTEGIIWYERAIELAPGDASIRLDFARSLAGGGLIQDAQLQFQTAIALDPTNPQAHFYLAEMYDQQSPPNVEKAIAEYRRTIELGPGTFIAERAEERLRELGGTSSPSPPS